MNLVGSENAINIQSKFCRKAILRVLFTNFFLQFLTFNEQNLCAITFAIYQKRDD